MPKESDAIEILPPSNTFNDCLKPSPTSPKRFSSGTIQLSKIISAVSLARIPNLFSFLPAEKPCIPLSTTKAVALFFVRGSPVRATTTATSPLLPCVIHDLVPLMIHSLFFLTAVHFMLPASLPVLGSVNPHAPNHSPEASFGKYFFFCSSFAKVKICPVHKELCAATLKPIEPHTFAISSIIILYSIYDKPEPPNSSGTK